MTTYWHEVSTVVNETQEFVQSERLAFFNHLTACLSVFSDWNLFGYLLRTWAESSFFPKPNS
jgi:hypothetical protein